MIYVNCKLTQPPLSSGLYFPFPRQENEQQKLREGQRGRRGRRIIISNQNWLGNIKLKLYEATCQSWFSRFERNIHLRSYTGKVCGLFRGGFMIFVSHRWWLFKDYFTNHWNRYVISCNGVQTRNRLFTKIKNINSKQENVLFPLVREDLWKHKTY